MNQTEKNDGMQSGQEAGETSLIDLLIVLAKNKRLLLLMPLSIAVLTGLVSLAVPNTYTAGVKLLPPQQPQSGAAAILSQLGNVAGAAASAAGIKNPNDLYVGMLKSRTIADKMIQQFDLQKVYDKPTLEQTRKKLASNTSIVSGKDGLIAVVVEDHDKQRVAKMANAYVTELINVTRAIAVTEAGQRRVFFERQLEQSKNNLAGAEMALKQALEVRGVISVDADSRAIVETVGRLRAQISAKEIQLGAMRAFVTTSNPEYKRSVEALASLKAELSKLENGRDDGSIGDNESGGKQVGLENIKILRDVKYHQMLYEILAKQYEVARLDEAKESSVIQVLDPAIEPERKSAPKRALMMVLAAVIGLALAVITILMKEAKQGLINQPGGAAKWAALRAHLSLRRQPGAADATLNQLVR